MQNIRQPMAPDQTLCWNCEEIVHTFTSQCPYCHANQKSSAKPSLDLSSQEKITQLPTSQPLLHQHQEEERAEQRTLSIGKTILSIVFLFGGCNLLFLAILVGLFSRDGLFTLAWPENHWPAYFGTGLSLVVLGCILVSAIDSKNE